MDEQSQRAATFGMLDGLVTSLGIVLGTLASGLSLREVMLAGIAAAGAGSISMGSGEFISMHNVAGSKPWKVGAWSFTFFLLGSAVVIVPLPFLPLPALLVLCGAALFGVGYLISQHDQPVLLGLKSLLLGAFVCAVTVGVGLLTGVVG